MVGEGFPAGLARREGPRDHPTEGAFGGVAEGLAVEVLRRDVAGVPRTDVAATRGVDRPVPIGDGIGVVEVDESLRDLADLAAALGRRFGAWKQSDRLVASAQVVGGDVEK